MRDGTHNITTKHRQDVVYETVTLWRHRQHNIVPYTFHASDRIQGADSLEVVHRPAPPGHDNPNPSGNNKTAAARGGIHSFGKCYIPYTSQGNKEVPNSGNVVITRTVASEIYRPGARGVNRVQYNQTAEVSASRRNTPPPSSPRSF